MAQQVPHTAEEALHESIPLVHVNPLCDAHTHDGVQLSGFEPTTAHGMHWSAPTHEPAAGYFQLSKPTFLQGNLQMHMNTACGPYAQSFMLPAAAFPV